MQTLRTITIPPALAAKAPKPLRDTITAYTDALQKLTDAQNAAEELRQATADLSLKAAEEALAAVRSGAPIPASTKDDVAARAELAERSITAFAELVAEREADLRTALDVYADSLESVARERHAAAATALLDAVGEALARHLPAYRETAGEYGWTRAGRWATEPGMWEGGTVRYAGQDREPLSILADALTFIARRHPDIRDRDAKVKEALRPGFEDRAAAKALLAATPTPAWATALGVEGA